MQSKILKNNIQKKSNHDWEDQALDKSAKCIKK